MVWLVEGTLNSDKDDGPDSLPPPSTHYLRPSRVYKIGRMGGVRAPTKPGAAKPGPASKQRPYDFRIASLSVSKEGMAEFECCGGGEEWDAEDAPDSPSNEAPYPLTVKVLKKLRLTRADGEVVDVSGESVQVQDGDHFQETSKGYWFRFTWQPLFFCFAAASVAQKKEYLAEAKKLGVKIAFKTFRPHHTHFVMKSASPTVHLLRAAVSTAHVVSPQFFTEVVARSACPPRPADPLPPHPGPPPQGATKEDLAAHDKLVSGWEKQLLSLNDDVGSDWARWWGHSFLEKDWESAWPREGEYLPERAAQAREWDVRGWERREGRRRLFEGCLVVSFRGNESQDEADASVVTSAAGTFFASDLLQRDPLPPVSDLLTAIADFKTDNPGQGGDESKVVIFPPPEVFAQDEGDDLAARQLELLRELQRALKVGKLCQGAELAQAVYHVDTSSLFGNDIPPPPGGGGPSQEQSGGSSSRRTQRTATQATQNFTQATPPFPTGGVPGTHPESGQPPPAASGSMDVDSATAAGAAAGESGSAATSQEAAPSQPRKLKRRAKTNRDVFEDLFDDISKGDGGAGSSSSRLQVLTQDEDGRGTLASGSGSGAAGSSTARMDVEPATPANPPAPIGRTTTLKRRAGKKDVFASMFGDDSPEKGTTGGDEDGASSAQTQSVQEDWRRKGKTRQERMQAIEEEDRRLAEEEALTQSAGSKAKGKGKAAAVVEEEEEEEDEDEARVVRRKKRDKSAAIGSGDSDEDRQPARKRTTKKDGAAPVATTSKRTRGQTRSPGAAGGSSSEEDESARPAARKKSKQPSAAADEPKNKKEAAALKKAEKEAQEKEKARLLQIKTTKRKGAEVDQAFNEDFNALKIVKPVLKSMPPVEKRRFGWDEDDSDVERHERLIREDQERLARGEGGEDDEDMDPDHWRRPTQAMFVVRTFEVERKERAPARTDVVLDPKWAGIANFKKFRPKNAKGPREPLAQRPQIQLVVPDAVDFGLGAGYNDRKGTSFSQVQQADDEDDEEDLLRTMTNDKGQVKLSFGPPKGKGKAKAPAKKAAASKAKGKGKAKKVVSDSEEEDQLASDDDVRSSNTLRADDMDLDDESPPPSKTSKKKATGRAPRKAVAETIIIDDDDSDSDSGLTFKGFEKKSGSSSVRARR